MLLDWRNKIVIVQFFMGTPSLVPEGIEERDYFMTLLRFIKVTGELVINHERGCDVSELPAGLHREGYYVEDALWKQRTDGCSVSFLFSGKGNPDPANKLLSAAKILANGKLWEVWAFEHPKEIVINLGSRCAVDGEKPKSFLSVRGGVLWHVKV
jgi:hypothetical protein